MDFSLWFCLLSVILKGDDFFRRRTEVDLGLESKASRQYKYEFIKRKAYLKGCGGGEKKEANDYSLIISLPASMVYSKDIYPRVLVLKLLNLKFGKLIKVLVKNRTLEILSNNLGMINKR